MTGMGVFTSVGGIFHPKILTTLKGYTRAAFLGDLSAGLTVGVVALPLAIAFGIASGVTPDRGLITAIVAGILISALGGSRVQIGGPTGAFVVIVYGIVAQHGVNGLILCTIMAGALLVLMGVLRLGGFIKFIPYPLTVGFTSGIAVIVFASQVRDFLGLKTESLPADFTEKIAVYAETISTVDLQTVALATVALLIIVTWPKVTRRIPGSLIAILVVTAVVQVFHLDVETIGSRFGAIPAGLPSPVWPEFSLSALRELSGPAFTVAFLAAIESLLSATVADGMIESRHRSNTELIAQGIANIATPLFGGIPATGAIARTATNVKNGGRTPVAGIIHSLTLLLIVILFGRWAGMIPMCVLAAILVVVAYHMSEWRAFRSLMSAPRNDIAVLLITFLLTVFIDLTVAVEVGLLLSVVFFIKRMTDVTTIREVTADLGRETGEPADEESLRSAPDAITLREVPDGVAVYEAEGAFFFGVAERLRDTLTIGRKPPRILILRMRHVLALDASGLRALADMHRSCTKTGTQLILSGIHAQPLFALKRSGLLDRFGSENVLPHIDRALARAREILSQSGSAP